MIALIDYGAGNLKSVANALDDLEVNYFVSNKADEINAAEKIIFPGVGEAASAMNKIKEKEIVDVIKNTNKPLLGICLGMQLLATFSEERNTKCLDIVKTVVKQFDSTKVKVPHMGWNKVEYKNANKLFSNVESGENFYFANSFYVPVNEYTIASTFYDTCFSASINKNNFYGVQFHPEKSGKAGLQILKNFIELC
ncbi:MAG: imidazole glycerol phosphate synthase subunit HisH [Ignavibacteriae bacterium]|nr:imidazole glycerol phosphate synthase subunit HisH [Ignavibacteriota bacterium]MCB9208642.1 imidazole glycerol phosphate synthase subunit HisH [Ignavibacteriales bacterium]MCB9258247.1 imidazole glycerol phosphate synthase subunit HisH [Ignavibacteriales bacterium]